MSTIANRVYQLIDEILWNDWDPIGVNDLSEARDEYRSYLSEIVNLKIAGAGPEVMAQHLFKIETSRMGLAGNLENCRREQQINDRKECVVFLDKF